MNFLKISWHSKPGVLQLLISSLRACVSAMVLVKLASSTDLQAAVLLHPGRITEDEINSKSSICQAHAKYMLQVACCLRCSGSLFQMLRFLFQYWELRSTILPHLNDWNSLERSCQKNLRYVLKKSHSLILYSWFWIL